MTCLCQKGMLEVTQGRALLQWLQSSSAKACRENQHVPQMRPPLPP